MQKSMEKDVLNVNHISLAIPIRLGMPIEYHKLNRNGH